MPCELVHDWSHLSNENVFKCLKCGVCVNPYVVFAYHPELSGSLVTKALLDKMVTFEVRSGGDDAV